MDTYSLMRMLGALATVLGILAGALWIVRRFGIRLPGRVATGGLRRLDLIERTALDSRRSVALIRRDGREHLILLAPEGNVVIEAAIVRDEIDHGAELERLEAQRQASEASKEQAEALRESFVAMVDKARTGVRDHLEFAQPMFEQAKARMQPAFQHVTARAVGGLRG
jgi:flagellar biogenesis protein FliO